MRINTRDWLGRECPGCKKPVHQLLSLLVVVRGGELNAWHQACIEDDDEAQMAHQLRHRQAAPHRNG